jgi:Spy/CpxP family protein refolding chaperone
MKLNRYLAGLLIATSALALPAYAQMQRGPHGHEGGRMMRQLDLTEAQRDQIFRIRHESAPAMRERMKSARAAQQALRQAAADPNADSGRIRQLADAVGKAHADAAVARVETHRKVLAILTPEQRSKLEQSRRDGRGHRGHPRGRA